MESIALIEFCVICVFVGFYFLEKAFRTARHYDPQPLEAKRIIVKKVNGHIITTTTRGGEQ